jgi:uncharacterized protein (DUF58 family)
VVARCVLVVTALVVIGLAAGRSEAVALAAPFVAGPALAYRGARKATTAVSLAVDRDHAVQGDLVEATVVVDASCDLDVVRLVLDADGFEPAGEALDWTIAVRAGRPYTATVPLLASRWGRRRVGPLRVAATTAGNLGSLPEAAAEPLDVAVYPRAQLLQAGTDTPSALAYAGEHPSARPGPGLELSAVRPFLPGDGLRQINWKATLRTGQLHSTTRLSDRSAAWLVLIDCGHDVGPPGSSSLDVSGQAALAISEHFLAIGDIVALTARGPFGRSLAGGTGQRQLARVREWLLDLRSVQAPAGPGAPGLRGAAQPPTSRAFVVAVSPLLDEHDAVELASLRQRGAGVLAIDVLSEAMIPAAGDETAEIARRLWLLEREMLLDRLRDLGVPVVRWSEQRSLDAALREVARLARAPRMALR